MKLFIIALIAFNSSIALAKLEVVCSKNILGQSYQALVSVDGGQAEVLITASSNRATRRGEQSEALIAEQSFSGATSRSIENGNLILMDQPVLESEGALPQISSAELTQVGADSSLVVKGEKLPTRNRIKFKDCEVLVINSL